MKLKKFTETFGKHKAVHILKALYQNAIFLAGAIILLAMIATVLLRYVFKMNLFGMDEIILCFVFWFYFFGGVNGSMEDSHIRADVIGTFIKNPNILWGLRLVTRIIEIAVQVFLIWLSVELFLTNCRRMPVTQGLKIPYIVPQFAIVVGFILMFLYNVAHLLYSIAHKPQEADKFSLDK